VAAHAKDALRCPSIAKILNLPLTVAATEACRTECLIARQDGKVLYFVAARTATVRAVIADEGAIAEEKEVRIRVEESAARVAAEAIQMPSIPS
jgi:hypothetical protein